MPAGIPDYINDDLITMTDSVQVNTYVLHSTADEYSCVDSFKLYGGPTQPFEYLVLSISKKRMSVLAPMLTDDIFAGLNIVTLYGFGNDGAQYIVTNCKTSGSTWKITAYAVNEQFKGYALADESYIAGYDEGGDTSNKNLLGNSPSSVIEGMVGAQTSSMFQTVSGIQPKKYLYHTVLAYKRRYTDPKTNSTKQTDAFQNNVFFDSGTSVWRVISICAMKLGCTVWVSGDTLYVVDFSIEAGTDAVFRRDGVATTIALFDDIGTIYLNSEGQFPYATSYYQRLIMNNVVGTPSPEQEGRNLVRNRVQVNIKQDSDDMTGKCIDSRRNVVLTKGQVISNLYVGSSFKEGNITYYNAIEAQDDEVRKSKHQFSVIQHELDMPELCRPDAQVIADNMALKYCDSEQPITFTMREVLRSSDMTNTGSVWEPAFPMITRAEKIFDYSNDLLLSSTSNLDAGLTRPQKGALSGWIRNFPEHTSTYTFGELAPTDLSQNDSIIKTALTSRVG